MQGRHANRALPAFSAARTPSDQASSRSAQLSAEIVHVAFEGWRAAAATAARVLCTSSVCSDLLYGNVILLRTPPARGNGKPSGKSELTERLATDQSEEGG